MAPEAATPAPINSRLNVVVQSPTPFRLVRNGCWPSRGSQLPQALPFIFSLCFPLNDRRRASHSFFKISRLFSLFLSFYPSLSLLCLLILLLLLISGNVHPNPGPIFPCSVCAGNVTRRSKSVQCCTCFKWVHLRCSQLSLSKFRTLDSSHSWSFPSCRNTVTPSSDSSDMYISTVQSGPPLLMLHSGTTLVFKPLIPHLPILCLLPLSPHHRSLLLAVFLRLLSPLSPMTLSGFFNGMLEVFEPGALNYFTLFRPILSTLSAFRNPILTQLPLSGFLNSLLCVLIAPNPSLAFSLLMPRTLEAAWSSFLSGRAYLFLNFLPPLYLRLIPTLNMWGSTSFLTTPPRSLFLMCMPPLFAPPQRMAECTPFLPPFCPPPEISLFLGTSIAITPSGTQEVLPTPVGRKYSAGSFLLTSSSPSMTLTHPPFLHRSSGCRSSPDISFSPSSLAFSCSWEVLQNLGSDHLPILLSVSFSPAYRSNERPPSFNFQKAVCCLWLALLFLGMEVRHERQFRFMPLI